MILNAAENAVEPVPAVAAGAVTTSTNFAALLLLLLLLAAVSTAVGPAPSTPCAQGREELHEGERQQRQMREGKAAEQEDKKHDPSGRAGCSRKPGKLFPPAATDPGLKSAAPSSVTSSLYAVMGCTWRGAVAASGPCHRPSSTWLYMSVRVSCEQITPPAPHGKHHISQSLQAAGAAGPRSLHPGIAEPAPTRAPTQPAPEPGRRASSPATAARRA